MRRTFEKYIGQTIYNWKIHGVNREKKEARFDATCQLCGKRKLVSAGSVLCGESKSDGCQLSQRISEAQVEDLTGQKFWFLTVERLAYVAKNRQCVWHCVCSCGQELDVYASNLKRNHTRSCGHIRMSDPEMKIKEFLIAHNIPHDYEFHFDDLKGPGGGALEFDFAIFDDDKKVIALIEYQGLQHYKDFTKDHKDFTFGKFQREVSDPIKKEYCKEKNIPLFEIRYDEDLTEKLNEFLIMIEACQANTVPSSVA